MKLTNEKLEVIKLVFKNYQERSEEVWKIKVNSEFFKTNKGKSTWNKENFARGAFVNFIENNHYMRSILKNKWNADREEINDLIKQLEDAGVVEFVRVI